MTIELDDIRRKAYELWEQRGRPLGSPEVDWASAEALLREAQGGRSDAAGAGEPQRAGPRYGLREIAPD